MASITESNSYASQIYMLDTTDWVEGGLWIPGTGAGVSNRQATELSSRCNWLLSNLSVEHLPTGEHPTANILGWVAGLLTTSHFDPAAAIAESKVAFGFIGMERPFGRGVYTNSAEMAADVLTASTSTTVDLELITNTVNSTIAAHNAATDAHPFLGSLATLSLAEFYASVKEYIVHRVQSYAKIMPISSGFLDDCGAEADAAAASSGHQFVPGLNVFRPANENSVPCVVIVSAPGALSLGGNPTSAWCCAVLSTASTLSIPTDASLAASKDNGVTWTSIPTHTLTHYGAGQYLLHGYVTLPAPDTRLLKLRVTLATGVVSDILCAGMITNV